MGYSGIVEMNIPKKGILLKTLLYATR